MVFFVEGSVHFKRAGNEKTGKWQDGTVDPGMEQSAAGFVRQI